MNNVSKSKHILITGARSLVALDLARHLNRVGHKVFVTDPHFIHFTLFSNAIEKSYTVPSPTFKPNEFIDRIVHITEKEQIDFVIPIFEEVICLSKAKDRFPKGCELFCSSFDTLHSLHNKWLFHSKLKQHNILSPPAILLKTMQELKSLKVTESHILKPCYSRGSMNIKRLDPEGPFPNIQINSNNPIIAQKWLNGEKYCSYSICRNGKVMAHAVYPFLFNEDHYCLRFEAIEHPKILKWVENFVKIENYTGQIAFDFIESNGKLYAIECNPRATFGFNLFEPQNEIHKAFFEDLKEPIQPRFGNAKQIAAGMLVYGWRMTGLRRHFKRFITKMFSTKDITFSLGDIKPFLFQPIVFLSYFFRVIKCRRSIIDLYLFDIEWNGENTSENFHKKTIHDI